jgi:hypothetical protein
LRTFNAGHQDFVRAALVNVKERGSWEMARMPTSEIITLGGLLMTMLGAGVAASGVIMSKETATDLSRTRWDENASLKAALLKQSRTAAAGLVLLASGTGLQMVAFFLAAAR